MSTTQAPERRGALRGIGSARTSTPQNLMVFVLSMALFGLANILLEIIPDVTIGPVDLSVAYFVFVPLTLAALLNPFWAALGAPLGEIVFTDLLMGDFSGLSELEGFIQMFLAIYVAGSVVRNPRSRPQIWLGALLIVGIDKFLSAVVDLAKVWVGVEDAEYVQGLPQSILLLEGVGFGIDLVISGILFGALPAMWLIPALHGRIEPLLGMRPRVPGEPRPGTVPWAGWFVVVAVLASLLSFVFAFLEAWDVSIGSVEADFRGQYGDTFLWVSVGALVVVLALAAILFSVWRRRRADR
ncbi:cell division protein FtsQ [Cellulomonas triticagri]|uniref:Cell division protein FtsQ n=1 Tax=Cellulomonas triticagri TaxID=2483352 RepID=A0A3M2JRQ9_9CELL|nr:cell division protein FtsQ [Cellulomonas triticagri]RMI12878.1 cell division protein FtsQ [Cellulomonas triticagri]